MISRAHSVAAPWQRVPGEFRYRGSHRRLGFVTLFPLGGIAIGASAALVFTAQANASQKSTSSQRSVSDDVRRALLDDARLFGSCRPASFCARRFNGRWVAVTTCFPLVGLGGASLALIVAHRVNEAPSRAEPGSRARYPPSLAEAPHIKCQIGQVCRLELRLHVRDLILSPCTARSHARRALSSRNARSGIANGEGRSPPCEM